MTMQKRKRRWVWAGLGVLIVVALTFAFMLGRPRPEVETARVTRGTFEQYVTEDGRTRVRDRFVVAAPIGGTVERTHLRVGDRVAHGAVLAALRPITAPLIDLRTRAELEQRVGAAKDALDRSRAEADRAEAARAHAEAELATATELASKGSISPREREHARLEADVATKERDAARLAVRVAEHQAEMARAALSNASRSPTSPPETFEIRAPVDGQVLRIYQESESPITLGAPLIEVADSSALEVVVDLLSTDAVNVTAGAEARVTGWGRPVDLPGRVRRVEPMAITKISALGVEEQRVNVIVDLTGSSDAWSRVGDGYRVDVHVLVERIDDALRIPTSALFREHGEWRLFVVKNERLEKRTVKLRAYGPRESAIAEGVDERDEVVVQPSESLEPGTRARARNAG